MEKKEDVIIQDLYNFGGQEFEQNNTLTTDLKQYQIDWDKVKTINDLKQILKIVAESIVIDTNNENDIILYNQLKKYLI